MLEGNVKPFVELGALPAMKPTSYPAAEGLEAKKKRPVQGRFDHLRW